ncbi:type-F conjugative transfer system pilin assembly protein TraF [Photobacterium sp. R1]
MMQPKLFMRLLSAMTILIFLSQAQAERPPGWRWYNEPIKKIERMSPTTQSQSQSSVTVTRTMSPSEQMEWFHSYYKDVSNDAFINSKDVEKVEKLMLLNQFSYNKSSEFGMTFQKTLLQNPSLSYIKDRPTEHAARSTYHDIEREKKIRVVRELADTGWGIMFFYDGKSEMANKLAPSLQMFSDTHGIELLGITGDGIELPSIRQNRINDNRFTVPFTPALFLVKPSTNEMKPLAYGFIAQEDLLTRFLYVATDFKPNF